MSALLVTLLRGRFILNLLLSFLDYFQHTGISLRSTINIIMKSTARALSPGKYYFFHTIPEGEQVRLDTSDFMT